MRQVGGLIHPCERINHTFHRGYSCFRPGRPAIYSRKHTHSRVVSASSATLLFHAKSYPYAGLNSFRLKNKGLCLMARTSRAGRYSYEMVLSLSLAPEVYCQSIIKQLSLYGISRAFQGPFQPLARSACSKADAYDLYLSGKVLLNSFPSARCQLKDAAIVGSSLPEWYNFKGCYPCQRHLYGSERNLALTARTRLSDLSLPIREVPYGTSAINEFTCRR